GALTLRPIAAADERFLYELYASTREDELGQLGWSAQQRDAFLALQFRAQQASFHDHWRDADLSLVIAGGRPIGRLYVARAADAIHLIDIAILPASRNAGVGTNLVAGLLEEAKRAGKPLRLHVLASSRARRLYDRLGFVETGEVGLYRRMEWTPPA